MQSEEEGSQSDASIPSKESVTAQNKERWDDTSLDEYNLILVKSAVNYNFSEHVYYFLSVALITKENKESDRNRTINMCVKSQTCNLKVHEAKAKKSILSSKKKRVNNSQKLQTKMKMLQTNKDVFTNKYSEEKYEEKINELFMDLT